MPRIIHEGICIYILPIACCPLPIDDLYLPLLQGGSCQGSLHGLIRGLSEVVERWAYVVVYAGLFLKVSSLSAIMRKLRIRAHVQLIRDQPFEQGMTIYIYI